jgi:hypothetical protein
MYRDKSGDELSINSTVLVNGCLYLIKDFVVYELAVEAICEDKLTHNFKAFQLHEVIKIS